MPRSALRSVLFRCAACAVFPVVAHHQVEFTDLEARIARERPQTRREQVRVRRIFRRRAAISAKRHLPAEWGCRR